MIDLLTCKRCRKQHVGSTVTEFCFLFNQYKSNIKLYDKGKGGFKQEKLIEQFFFPSHSGTHKDISIQIIDHCDPNDQKRREDFWIYHLHSMFPNGLNEKKLVRYNYLCFLGLLFLEIIVT